MTRYRMEVVLDLPAVPQRKHRLNQTVQPLRSPYLRKSHKLSLN